MDGRDRGAGRRRGTNGAVHAQRSATMAEVAKFAGVSQQTVSRVLNGLSNVSVATRERVEEAMAHVGYRPNFAGRALRGGLYRTVGLSVFDIARVGNAATLEGIVCAAHQHDYAVTMFEVPRDIRKVSLSKISYRLASLPVDGIIINMNRRLDDFDTFTPFPGLKTVLLTMYEHPRCTTVDCDQYGCAQMVVHHLIARGHREIRYLGGTKASVSEQFREKGWRDALAEVGLTAAEPSNGDWTADSGYEAGLRLAEDREMTALFASNDQMAYGAMLALQERGLRVPEDVSVVGIDDSLDTIIPNNRLTTVRFDMQLRGRVTFEHAVGLKSEEEPQAIRIPGELVERATVAEARR